MNKQRKIFTVPFLVVLVILLAMPVAAFGKSNTEAVPTNKGTVGWDIYRQLDRLHELKSGVETKQFSSYDRNGGNNDGFEGTYSCLRQDEEGCVIAESEGAGEVESIWFTRDGGDVTRTGNIKIVLDGKTVVDASLQAVVNGELGAPFLFPLVANGDQTSGGVYIKIPMPYKESMKVVTTNNPYFYHVTYRAFSDAVGVKTFDPTDKAEDVIELLKKSGTQDPKPEQEKAKKVAKNFQLAPGEKVRLANLNNPGSISELRMQIPQIIGPTPGKRVIDDGRAFTGYSEFTAAVNPENEAVRITRRLDKVIGNQKANLLIDGVNAGVWGPLPAGQGWLDQTIEIPAELTAGKENITIKNKFVSSDVDFKEFSYFIESKVNGEWVQTDVMDLGPNSLDEEAAHNYQIVDQKWQGVRDYQYPPTGDSERIAASDDVLQNARVRITFDGELMVDSPVGEFFGSAFGEYNVKSLFFSMDTNPEGWYTSWWPMPYKKSAKVELYNGSEQEITAGKAEVTFAKSGQWAKALGSKPTSAYFRTTSHKGEVTGGQDWTFLNTIGKGTIVGVSHSMEGKDFTRNYLEGDERVYVDEANLPQIHGTGTEDFYESGWYFNRGTFTNPLNGNTAHEVNAFGTEFDSTGAYRLLIGDSVSFNTSARFGIEVGWENNVPAHYGSTTYWYGIK